MPTRTSSRSDFEEFVAVCSGRLLRTAYLLTGDSDVAEELLQTGLTKAWSSWQRLDAQPEPYVRRVMVTSYTDWWRRRWQPRQPADLPEGDEALGEVWVSLGRLSRRHRAVVVLRHYDGLAEEDIAEMLGSTVGTVRRQAAKAPPGLADAAEGVEEPTFQQRMSQVGSQVAVAERRRRATTAVAVASACVAVIAAFVLVPAFVPDGNPPGPTDPTPTPDGAVDAPPVLVGHQLQPVLRINGLSYEYFRSEESPRGRESLKVAVAPYSKPQALAWASPGGLIGRVVVSVDGDRVAQDPAGLLGGGVLLSANRVHLVVVRATSPTSWSRLGLAVYRLPR
jgi:RNA polymerase sigma-70 factor (sigma-E family)